MKITILGCGSSLGSPWINNYWGNLQYGYGAALALVLVAIGVIMSFTFLKIFRFNDLIKQPRIEQ